MSVRTFDPKEPEVYRLALCSEQGCYVAYHSICRICNRAFCFQHLKIVPHCCDTHQEFLVLTEDEVLDLFGRIPVFEITELPRKAHWTSSSELPKEGNGA